MTVGSLFAGNLDEVPTIELVANEVGNRDNKNKLRKLVMTSTKRKFTNRNGPKHFLHN